LADEAFLGHSRDQRAVAGEDEPAREAPGSDQRRDRAAVGGFEQADIDALLASFD